MEYSYSYKTEDANTQVEKYYNEKTLPEHLNLIRGIGWAILLSLPIWPVIVIIIIKLL